VALAGEYVAGVGADYEGIKAIDLKGQFLLPGLIDGHTHLESSLLSVSQYSRAVVPRGTTTIITDLHEIANVAGLNGVRSLMGEARRLPLDIFLMVPSCVPATHLETAGAEITTDQIRLALRWKDSIGLGEMMNFPGVLFADGQVLDKISAAKGAARDGHAPGLSGKDLNAYLATGIGSDHESPRLAEAREKLRRGMHVMIREGSSEKNLEELLPLVNDNTYHRCFFVVDDRSAHDLMTDGDMDAIIRKAVSLGLEPVRAIQMATINTARYFGLGEHGAVAPGYVANLMVTDDLTNLQALQVFSHGRLVAENGSPLFRTRRTGDASLLNTVNLKPFGVDDLGLPTDGWPNLVIEIVPGQIITRKVIAEPKVADGFVVADTDRDMLKLVVAERHRATGNMGRALARGFGLKRGALATSIAHDSHNIVAAGVTDGDIYAAIKEVERIQGGLAIAVDGKVVDSLPLPIAGLLSPEPVEAVASKLETLENIAQDLGSALAAPFATLSFLALPVIPELRLTDKGLVDVNEFRLIS
jgi:adenine deaminase